MRLFVAIDLPEAIRAGIARLMTQLKPASPGLRWGHPGGIHLTLKFIGEVAGQQAAGIRRALGEVKGMQPAEIRVAGAGFFPNDKHARVFWIGVEANPALGELAEAIESKLDALGVRREERAFHPHLTLGRFREPENPFALKEAITSAGAIDLGSFGAREFYLFQSYLSPKGAEYTKLERYLFAPEILGNG